jgi:hypothetical protein
MIEEGRRCGMCGVTVADHHMQLARRVERMELSEHNGQQLKTVRVFSDDVFMEFCDPACWKGREADVTTALELNVIYPNFHWIASCSRCGAAVNRTSPYVTLNIYEVIEESSPWLATEKVLGDKEFAVLCKECNAPVEAESAIYEEAQPIEEKSPA